MTQEQLPGIQEQMSGDCPYCKKKGAALSLPCHRCHVSHCVGCILTVGRTVLCPHCLLIICAKQTTPKPVNEWNIWGGHSIRCVHCKEEFRTGDDVQYHKLRIREDMSIWCETCCAMSELPAVKLIVDEVRRQC